MEKILFTSESVTEGHPDKMCDAISDAILDALMEKDPMSRVACETATTTGLVLVMGEITTNAYVDIQKIVRDTIREIGYTRGKYGFDADTCAVITAIDEQSADIALGVDKALEAKMGEDEIDAIGAGDQGIQFGYASNETEEYMPYAINMAHKLARQLTKIRKDGTLKYLRPDGKTQVTVEYDEAGKPIRIDAVVCSTQHDPDVTQEQIHEDIKKYVFDEIIQADMLDENTKYLINKTGRFVIGGPHGDSGLTGRKIIVDTYGGTGRHGGGAFSGKDCTKVDRSAAYAARYVAKNIVAYREENGAFTDRKQLLKVPKLGKKAFEQCAGFLRVRDGKNPLDNTAVHPESYEAAKGLMEQCGFKLTDIGTSEMGKIKDTVNQRGRKSVCEKLGIGVPTLTDIIEELQKPGRDPRDELPAPLMRSGDIMEIKDLKPGMELVGTVRNVIDFGAFVDIGVHEDGLVHISQICDRFIKHPLEAVSVGDVVDVEVMSVDIPKKRIQLTMKGIS